MRELNYFIEAQIFSNLHECRLIIALEAFGIGQKKHFFIRKKLKFGDHANFLVRTIFPSTTEQVVNFEEQCGAFLQSIRSYEKKRGKGKKKERTITSEMGPLARYTC